MGSQFLSPAEIGLHVLTTIETPAKTKLPSVSGITVNTVHGDDKSISQIVHRLNPQVETMEGAACMLACQKCGCIHMYSLEIFQLCRKAQQSKLEHPFGYSKFKFRTHSFFSKSMKLTLGFSSCPNDSFMFDALVHSKIDTEGLQFEVLVEDVEALNQKAFNKQLDVSKLSFHALSYCLQDYALLECGSALGRNCGLYWYKENLLRPLNKDALIAIPGKYTTANMLLSIAFPHLQNKKEFLFFRDRTSSAG